jgi:serine/threonine protein kinase/tetratricopeptide (TPR) repeat protein
VAEAGEKTADAGGGEEILERGRAIDRFVVLGLVGRGGMGAVYAAYDPELDRKVAIKLLRARGNSGEGKARLLREAQATAKLQHPNVVVVYDVGTFGDSVFIAMEFIEGKTANGWLHAAKRTRREILDVYLAAGRGLAAAHAAGLVHRDFKPDNVMVTNDGQVRVMDFGLAQQVGDGDAAPRASKTSLTEEARAAVAAAQAAESAAVSESHEPEGPPTLAGVSAHVETPSGRYLSIKLTQTGAMLGTPAYMAPEQFAVRPTDARTDQFSFCVALYEALYGQRPFAGETFLALMTSVTTGAVSASPPKAKVPAWLRRLLLRGLATEPARRFSSMNELLTALATDPNVRRRRLLAGAAVLACAVVVVLAGRRLADKSHLRCAGGAERLAGVWEPPGVRAPRRALIQRAFEATGKVFAGQAFLSASRYLDDYVHSWLGSYREACEATHVRGEQSSEVLDLRMGCLNERLVDLRALTDQFAAADDKVVENAVSGVSALGQVERCSDVPVLRAVMKPPADEGTRRRVAELQEKRARLNALRFAGKCDEVRTFEKDLVSRARALAYAPLLAEVLSTSVLAEDGCGAAGEVTTELAREAFVVALSSGHDQIAATSAMSLAYALADRMRRLDSARQWLAVGRAIVARMGGAPFNEAELDQAEGIIFQYERNEGASLAAFERGIATNRRLRGPEHPYVALLLVSEGSTFEYVGKHERAVEVDRQAAALFRKVVGSEHPWVAIALSNEAESLNALRRYSEARVALQEAVSIWSKQKSAPEVLAYGQTGIGIAFIGEGRPTEAIPPLEQALAVRVASHAPPELAGETRFALARALWSRPAERSRALSLARLARVDYVAVATAKENVAAIDAWLRAPSGKL